MTAKTRALAKEPVRLADDKFEYTLTTEKRARGCLMVLVASAQARCGEVASEVFEEESDPRTATHYEAELWFRGVLRDLRRLAATQLRSRLDYECELDQLVKERAAKDPSFAAALAEAEAKRKP